MLATILRTDVTRIYNSETKVINQVVRRNIERFPEEFCFQLTKEEYMFLRSQSVTSKEQSGNRYFKELLQRVRDIWSSEKNFYQQVIDIYATRLASNK